MPYINTPNELKHYGVPDMHWGERKYQYKDGSLTPEGRVHYGYNTERANANLQEQKDKYRNDINAYKREVALMGFATPETSRKYKNAQRNIRYAKEDLSDEKTKEKLNKETKVSKRRENLEAKYREKGMTEEEAAIAAYKRERTEKILAVAGGVAVTALAAYGAYKYHDYAFDKVIPSGTKLQNISKFANKGVDDAFFASWKNNDNSMYRGLYGRQTKDTYGKAYEAQFKVTGNGLKIASRKNAQKVMNDLMINDSDFKNKVGKIISDNVDYYNNAANEPNSPHGKMYRDALKAFKSGKYDNSVYKALNTSLVERSPEAMSIRDKLYNTLKNNGYSAIEDVNDQRSSIFGRKQAGYGSASPLIVFDGKSTLKSLGSRELGDYEINDNYKDTVARILARDTASLAAYSSVRGAPFVAAVIGGKAYSKSKHNDKIVADYRKEHPNTELSYKEIVRQYEEKLSNKT